MMPVQYFEQRVCLQTYVHECNRGQGLYNMLSIWQME